MALYATNRFAGDGATTSYELNFAGKYIDRAHVKAYQEDNATGERTHVPITASNFLNDTTLVNLPVTPVGKTLVIYRDTPKRPLVDFTNGARFTETNLDTATRQGAFIAVEHADALDKDGLAGLVGRLEGFSRNAATTAGQAVAAAGQAGAAAAQAIAAAGAIGPVKFYDTHAQALSGVSNLADGDLIEVSNDETRAGARTRYKVQAGALVFLVNLDQTKIDLIAATGASLVGFQRAGTGAVPTTVQSKLQEVVSVKDFGAVGDGFADDTAAIQNAVNYLNSQGGGQLFFPRGIYITSGVTVYTNIWLVGAGRSITTLKLKNGANQDVIMGYAAYDLLGTNSGGGVQNVGLFNLTIDGNRANNLTSGSGIVLYGEEFYFENLSVTQTREHGIRTEWGRGDSVFGMESHYSNIRIDGCGMDGWNNNGPHDSVTFNLIVTDASLNADRTFHGLVIGPNMTGRYVSCHVWSRAASFRHGWALRISAGGGGNEFIGCHFEGAWLGNAGIFCSNNTFDPTCQFYSAWNGVNVYLGEIATFNVIKGRLGGPGAGRPASVGVVLGGAASDWVANNAIDVFSVDQDRGAISFVNSDGENEVTVRGYHAVGGVGVVGNPKGTDIVDIRLSIAGVPFVCSNIIQSGTVFIGAAAGATFTFPYPFGTVPHVTFSPSGPSDVITAGVWISSTGASSVSFYNHNPVSMTLHVIARRSN